MSKPMPPLELNISEGPLKLWICGACHALCMRDDAELHVAWHERIGDSDG